MHLKSLNKVIVLILFFVLAAGSAFAQLFEQNKPKQYQIAGITVEGNKFADAGTIIALSGLEVGKALKVPSDNSLQKAIMKIWGRKQFSDVDIRVDKITQVGVFLVIDVKEFPRLNKIVSLDNEEVNDEDIKKAVDKVRGDLISNYDIYLSKKAIQKVYEEEGLSFALIEAELIETDSTDYANLVFDIDEGVEFYANSITVEGNTAFDDGELIGSFDDTKLKSWYEFWASAKFDKIKYEEDKKLLMSFFRKNGHVDAEILSDTVMYDPDKGTVDIVLKVDEGKKIFVRNIDFEGNTVYTDEELFRRLDFKNGEHYDMERFTNNLQQNQEQSDVASLYLNNGYLTAKLLPEEKRINEDTVDIVVNIYENDRFRIRRVNIIGNSKTKDKVIRRELFTRPGDYFDRSALIRSVRALGMMNYFNPEALKPDIKPVDNTRVDVSYTVEERSTDTFNAQIGFAGSFGLTGAVGFTFNNFSLEEPWKGGAGQIFNFNWEFGQANRLQNISLGFTEPWLFDSPTTLGFNIFDSRINYNYKLRRTGIAVNLGRRFRWPDDYWRGSWGVRYQVNDVSEDVRSATFLPGKNTEVTLTQTISRISLNNPFFATSGSKFSLTTQVALGNVGIGTTDFFKNEIKFEMYNPVWSHNEVDRIVFMVGTHFGHISTIGSYSQISDANIPPIEYYSMGGNGLGGFGVTPLRGYKDRVINPSGRGSLMAKHSAELRFALSLNPMPIYLYGFAEAGNVWSDLSVANPFELKRAAGIGLQMMMQPLGIIGFSYGYGFDVVDATGRPSGWNFLFHLGQR